MLKKKRIDVHHTLIYTQHFPYNAKTDRKKNHKVILGIGGNIGDVLRRFEHLFYFMKKSPYVHLLQTAPIVKNPPFGYVEQDDFYNSLMVIETNLTPRALLRYILRVEKLFGRKRLFKDGPRTLDIDIIFYDDLKMQTRELTLPHPQWMKRTSVLIPLQYLSYRK